jgi:peptidoglycan biosynthesis protein MviN/MurJ (putative lipid II flippase)
MFSIFITGGFTYIARDLIVRVFYSIGDGVPPFRTSILTVTVNGTLNWLFVCYFALGSQGIVLSTVIANGVSTLVLLYALTRKIGSLHHVGVPIQLIKVSVAGLLSSAATRLTQSYLISLQQSSLGMYVPFITYSWAESTIVLCLSATSGVISFIITMVFLRADEFLRDDVFPV